MYSSLHLVVERMEELMEGTSLEESGWFQGEIFQITCSVSWYGRFWSTTNFWYSWKRAPLPPSSLAGSRRGTEASRAAAWWFELLLRVSRGFVTRISSYFLSYSFNYVMFLSEQCLYYNDGDAKGGWQGDGCHWVGRPAGVHGGRRGHQGGKGRLSLPK